MSTHTYYCLETTPGPANQPAGYIGQESWWPKRCPADFPRGAYGTVTYPKPLLFDEIDTFDLFPQNLLEQVVFITWLDNDRDPGITQFILNSYWQLKDTELGKKILIDDFTAFDVKRLKDNGYTWSQVLSCLDLEAVNA